MYKLFLPNKSQKKTSWKKIKANETHSSTNSNPFPTKHSASSLSSQRTSRTLIESHSDPIPMPVRSLSLPPTLAMPKPRYTVYPTQDLLKSYENEKTQIESSSDELSESETKDVLKEIKSSERDQSQEYKYSCKSIVTDSTFKTNNIFECPLPQSIQRTPPATNMSGLSENMNDNDQITRQRSASTHSGYHLTASSDSTDSTSKNTTSSIENITKPSTIDSFVSRPLLSSELSATIGSDVTQNMKNKYTNNHDKPPEPLETLSSEQEKSMPDSTTSLLNAEIQAQLQKLALREDLEDLRRVIDMFQQQSIRDREEQKKVDKELFDQLNMTKQRLDELTLERNQSVEENVQTRKTGKSRENVSEPATTRHNRKSYTYPEQQDDGRYFYGPSRSNYDMRDYPLPRSFMYEMDNYNKPFYMDDYLYDLDQPRYPMPPTRKNRPRSRSAEYQRTQPTIFDSPNSTHRNSSRKSSIRSSRSNRSKDIHREDLEEKGYHSAAEEEDDIPKPSSKPSGSINNGNEGRGQEDQREVPISRHSSRGSSGRFRRRPSNTGNNMASSIPPHPMYHNPGFRPPPHYLPMNPNRVNERERLGSIPYNIPPGNEYPHQYVSQGMSPRHMVFSEGPPLQSMGWPPNANQNIYGIPPHHHRPPPGGNSGMAEPMAGNSTGSRPIPNYETGQDNVSQPPPPGMRRYPPQQHGYQPLYPDSGQMMFLQ